MKTGAADELFPPPQAGRENYAFRAAVDALI